MSGRGLKVHLLDRASERVQGFFLFEVEGFVSATDLGDKPPAPAGRTHVIGAYAAPLVWPIGGRSDAARGPR